jgi:glycosyltransferase involved in cell wall biosynthesis
MKKVLIVAYQFPPMGGSGVQRTIKFVKYLRRYGYEPVVLTRKIEGMALKDESLLKDIPPGVRVIRTSPWDFTGLPGIAGLAGKFFGRKVLIPDSERLWAYFSRKTAVQTIREEGIELVYTTSYPYSDHLLGLHLKKEFPRIPWVADFRDEWTNNPYLLDNPHYRLRMNLEKQMEKQVLQRADSLITNTPVMLENFLKIDPALQDRFHVIPNGYDEEDFQGLVTAKPVNTRFTITYTGLLYGRRKPDVFFEAVKQLIRENRIDPAKFHVQLIGDYKVDAMNGLIETYGLTDVIKILPYMKHNECLERLAKSDALLLLEGNGPGAEAFYTGKVFEYMNTGRPILAVIPGKGAAARLVRETETGYVADYADIEGSKVNIAKLYEQWLNKSHNFSPRWDAIRKFERKALTQRLSEVFAEAGQRVKKGTE